MLAYLIIGIELAILYTVFWYVFLREPRPYKIKENIWGYYPGFGKDEDSLANSLPENLTRKPNFYNAESQSPDHGHCAQCASHANQNEMAIKQEWEVDPDQQVKRYFALIRCQKNGVQGAYLDKGGNNYRAEVNSTDASQGGKFLSKLGESLNTANIKLP